MPSNHLLLCRPLLLLPSIFHSVRGFSNESVLRIRWPEYWSFSFSISPSNEYSGLISFRMGWLVLLAVRGTLKSLQGLVYHKGLTISLNFWNTILEWKNRAECGCRWLSERGWFTLVTSGLCLPCVWLQRGPCFMSLAPRKAHLQSKCLLTEHHVCPVVKRVACKLNRHESRTGGVYTARWFCFSGESCLTQCFFHPW